MMSSLHNNVMRFETKLQNGGQLFVFVFSIGYLCIGIFCIFVVQGSSSPGMARLVGSSRILSSVVVPVVWMLFEIDISISYIVDSKQI